MKKISIVLGNGFDLNLMLRTSYSDFAKSREFCNLPKSSPLNKYVDTTNPEKSLYAHLQSVFDRQNWFDIEEEIYRYASKLNNIPRLLPLEFDSIKDALKRYLIRVVKNTMPCQESLAYQFMKNVIEDSDSEISIFNFNYTNCLTLCNCNLRDKVYYCNIHGDLTSDIVLGYYDYKNMFSDNTVSFMDKSFMLRKAGFGISTKLKEANDVIFFGHSLNPMDFSYFKSYFDYVVKAAPADRSLAFICLDGESILDIKWKLKTQGYDIRSLHDNLNNVDFIRTHNWNERNEKDVTIYDQLINRLCTTGTGE